MKNELRQLSILLLCVVSAPALACRLEWQYPADAHEPERFRIWHEAVGDYTLDMPGNVRSAECHLWFRGHLVGEVRVVAEYGSKGADLYQIERSWKYQYNLSASEVGVLDLERPHSLEIIQPGGED